MKIKLMLMCVLLGTIFSCTPDVEDTTPIELEEVSCNGEGCDGNGEGHNHPPCYPNCI